MKRIQFICILAALCLCTSFVCGDPHFSVHYPAEWEKLLNPTEPDMSLIRPMEPLEWQRYMEQWKNGELEGEPYPEVEFMPPDLTVWENEPWPPSSPIVEGDTPGLVMAWGDDNMPPGEYGSAWVYQYGVDPDLSSSSISIKVIPPLGINNVSLGLRDVNGLVRSWQWNVPGTIPAGVATPITIDLSQTGVNAATPPAAGYVNTPGFDITQVIDIIADENGNPAGFQPVPPPGQQVPRLWNYWYDMTVYTNKVIINKGTYKKWSQPPVLWEDSDKVIMGWDELSIFTTNPDLPGVQPVIVADDWLCKDDRPITDVHWWGSFLGWDIPNKIPKEAQNMVFLLGIWTDVPVNPDDPDSFSHPGELVWLHRCDNWVWNWAGFDRAPWSEPGTVDDTCFQFNQLLAEPDWFYQKPGPEQGTVYWLSIAAVYPQGVTPKYPWGWKTRSHYFNDDAVRIFQIINLDGTFWPVGAIQPGSKWVDGMPIEEPEGVSWDLSFELTTNLPVYEDEPGPGDLDADGIVDLIDFEILSSNWLRTFP